ncbi:hypothetical protein SUDANB95_02060 [Actinosynnema sp. ALI-1.44]
MVRRAHTAVEGSDGVGRRFVTRVSAEFSDEFERFYIDNYEDVRGFIKFLHPNGDDEAIAQEVFMRTLRCWDTARRNPRAYVFKSARHEVYATREKALRQPTVTLQDEHHVMAAPTSGVEDWHGVQEVLADIQRLPEKLAQVLILDVIGLGVAEIAEVMALDKHTVSNYKVEARRRLRTSGHPGGGRSRVRGARGRQDRGDG